MMRSWLAGLGVLAGLCGAAGVALAAYGAHRSADPTITTAAHFLLFHAAALVGLCATAKPQGARGILLAASIIGLGTILFSGDLALRAIAGLKPMRLAAPTGGVLLIVGWLVAAITLPLSLVRDQQ